MKGSTCTAVPTCTGAVPSTAERAVPLYRPLLRGAVQSTGQQLIEAELRVDVARGLVLTRRLEHTLCEAGDDAEATARARQMLNDAQEQLRQAEMTALAPRTAAYVGEAAQLDAIARYVAGQLREALPHLEALVCISRRIGNALDQGHACMVRMSVLALHVRPLESSAGFVCIRERALRLLRLVPLKPEVAVWCRQMGAELESETVELEGAMG